MPSSGVMCSHRTCGSYPLTYLEPGFSCASTRIASAQTFGCRRRRCCSRIASVGDCEPSCDDPGMRTLVAIFVAAVIAGIGTLAPIGVAAPPPGIPPANAPPVEIAGQFLLEISELKTKPMLVACVTIHHMGPQNFVFLGGAIVKGNVMLLSTHYVCQPLAYAWRHSPIFTGRSQPSLPLSSIDAVEIVAQEWFHTQGLVSPPRSTCRAVEYTWKWLRRSDLSPSFLALARRHLLNNSLRPPGYTVSASCLDPQPA